MSRIKEIQDYLIARGDNEDEVREAAQYSTYLSMEIMAYAFRDKPIENEKDYVVHAKSSLQIYRDLVGIIPDDPFCIDVDLMFENGVFYEGVQEVCLLQDVISNSDFTIEDIEEIFNEYDLGRHFRLYIKQALLDIAYNKEMDFKEYIKKCVNNEIASLCKMTSIQDDLNMFSLKKFDKDVLDELQNDLILAYLINKTYGFIDGIKKYRKEFKKEK